MSGQTRTPDEIGNIVIKTTPAGAPIRIGDVATVHAVRDAGLHHRHRQRQAGRAAEHLPPAGQQHRGGGQRGARRNRADSKELPQGWSCSPFYDQSEIVNDSIKSVRDAILLGLVLASLIMVLFLRDWGTSLVAGLVIPATIAVTFIALRVWARAST